MQVDTATGDRWCAAVVRCAVHSGGQNGGKLSAPVAAAAQWKSRGAETLVALQAQSPSGLKKAAQALRQAFSADLYGAGETTLPAAVVEALERHDKLLICADAAAGALLEARLENLPGAEKVLILVR